MLKWIQNFYQWQKRVTGGNELWIQNCEARHFLELILIMRRDTFTMEDMIRWFQYENNEYSLRQPPDKNFKAELMASLDNAASELRRIRIHQLALQYLQTKVCRDQQSPFIANAFIDLHWLYPFDSYFQLAAAKAYLQHSLAGFGIEMLRAIFHPTSHLRWRSPTEHVRQCRPLVRKISLSWDIQITESSHLGKIQWKAP